MSYKSEHIDDDQTIWVTSSCSSMCLHVDPDCHNLKRANKVYERKAGIYHDDARVCLRCTGRAKERQSYDYGTSYYEAAKAAGKAETGD